MTPSPSSTRALKPVQQPTLPATPGTQVRLLKTELEQKDNENESLQNKITGLTKALDSLTLVKDKAVTAFSKDVTTTAANGADTKKKKVKKDPNAPEPAKTAYRYFCKSMETNADGSDVDTRLMWKECKAELRKQYTDLAATDKVRFDQENAIYQSKLAEQHEQDAALEAYYEKQKQQVALEFYEAHLAAQTIVDQEKMGKKKQSKKDPAAPKRAMSSYMYFVKEHREQVAKEHPDLKVTEISKILGEQWGTLEKGKRGKKGTKKYDDLAAKDKERYEVDKAAYNVDQEQRQKEIDHERGLQLEKDKEEAMKLMLENHQHSDVVVAVEPAAAVKKTKKTKVPGAPKKANSAYIYFVMNNRKTIKEGLAETTTNQELLAEVGRQWRELDEAGRALYADMAAKDKVRYQKEMEAFTEL